MLSEIRSKIFNIKIRLADKIYYAIVDIIHKKPLPLTNTIILESFPDMADNTRAVFDEMIRRGMNKKYRFIWMVREPDNFKDYNVKNVFFLNRDFVSGIKNEYLLSTAKCLIHCNGFLKKNSISQISIYLTHGSPIKSLKGYYELPDDVDYVVGASDFSCKFIAQEMNIPLRKMIPLGFSRNDILRKHSSRTKRILNAGDKKVIIWYPTYRQKIGGQKLTASTIAVPVLHDENSAKVLNETAKQNNVLIVLKPHFAQNVSIIKKLELSNIRFIADDFYVKENISPYEFLSGTDALLTDYSSVCFDYSLCNRPIALIWEDVEEYRRQPGFADGIEPYLEGYEKLYNIEDLQNFIERIANNVDLLKNKRNEINKLANANTDEDCVGKVVDFIIEKAHL